ncbi:MAG: CIA30 family protein [Pseudomonadota bacterium]
MMTLLILAFLMTAAPADRHDLMDLAAGPWVVVDDRVMGGVSQGNADFADGVFRFSGELSLDNNGGFSSARLPLTRPLTGYRGIRLTVRGDGRSYQLRLREGRRFDGVAWRTDFVASDKWTTIELPFDQFWPGFRGRAVPSAGPVDPDQIRQIGVLLGDKKPGTFAMELRSLEGIPADPAS